MLSSDIQIIEELCSLAEAMAIRIEPCGDSELATSKLNRSKFEGIIIDLELKEGFDLLRRMRNLSSNKSSVSYAILAHNHEQAAAFQAGANFVFERPLNSASAGRVLRASYPLMVREKRRYFRYAMEHSVLVRHRGEGEFTATTVNLSESGICFTSGKSMQAGDSVALRLRLPGQTEYLQITGEICWSEASGKVGVQFRNLKPEIAETLREFMAERLEESLCTNPQNTVPRPDSVLP